MRAKIGPSNVPGEKAGPNGSFPIGDAKHARLAISGATRSFNAGNIGKSTEEAIKAKARAKLGNHASGLDKAMSDHADKIHPVGRR
jgi:hypothetical protein